MEDKNITTEQSLEIISRMIVNARQNFNDIGGSLFLIWGYTTIAVTLAVYITFRLTQNFDTMWLWWLIPIISGTLTWRRYRRFKKPVRSHIDKSVLSVWIVFFVAMMACMVFGVVPWRGLPSSAYPFPTLFIIALIMSATTAVTGLIIKFRPLSIGGFAGIFLSFTILIINSMMDDFLAFAGLFLLVQVIPGHLLDRACKRESREGSIVDLIGFSFSQKQ